MASYTHIIGVDEVGRGPLAGPVTLAAVLVRGDKSDKLFATLFKGVRDSKKLSPKIRERWYKNAVKARREGMIDFAVASSSAAVIDRVGISKAIKRAVRTCLTKLNADPKTSLVLLDGSLYAPEIFIHQRTIIKGDDKEPVIGLASIVAKVSRDRKLGQYSTLFPGYGFDVHKGYGTKLHQKALRALGPCKIHRSSFLGNFHKNT